MIARHGFTQLYEPPEGTATVALYVDAAQSLPFVHSNPRRLTSWAASIIFVHGLFGHPYHTWASKSSSSRSKSPSHRSAVTPSHPTSAGSSRSSLPWQKWKRQELVTTANTAETVVLWPRDLLPAVVRDARIFTWGYDADIDRFGSASQSTIYQHAGSLLSDIADQREDSPCYRAPILFVVHNLGGIVVKAALNRSSATQGTRLKDITPSTFGVCFLGTQHRGSHSASLCRIAFEVTRVTTRWPNTRLLRGLERNSETLEQIGDTFAQTMLTSATKLRVYSFREEKETRKYLFFNTMVSLLYWSSIAWQGVCLDGFSLRCTKPA